MKGLDMHKPGAKDDNGKIRVGLMVEGFARALEAVAEISTYGAHKYSDGGWQHVPKGVARYSDAMGRHWLAECMGEKFDDESGLTHAAHLAWNALARLELLLRQDSSQEKK